MPKKSFISSGSVLRQILGAQWMTARISSLMFKMNSQEPQLYLILFLKKAPATARLIGKKKYVDKKNNFKLSSKSKKMSFQKFISLV